MHSSHDEIYFDLVLSLIMKPLILKILLSSFKIKNLNLLKFKFTRDTLKPITSYDKIITFSYYCYYAEYRAIRKWKKCVIRR